MGGLLLAWVVAWLVLLPAALILFREPRRGHNSRGRKPHGP